MRGEPPVDAFVSRTNAPGGFQHPGDEKTQADRKQRDQRQSGEHRYNEHDRRMNPPKRARQPYRQTLLACAEDRDVPPLLFDCPPTCFHLDDRAYAQPRSPKPFLRPSARSTPNHEMPLLLLLVLALTVGVVVG